MITADDITQEVETRPARKRFVENAWDRLHVMSKTGHVDRKRLEQAITYLIRGEAILDSGVIPSQTWDKACQIARNLGVRE